MQFADLGSKVMRGLYLDKSEAEWFIGQVRSGDINDLQFVSMLAAMETRNTIRGISTEECSDLIRALRTPIEIDMNVLCNSGTGRDRVKTINISTPAAVVIASAGVRVLKNGSRKLTGYTGSRDVIEALGLSNDLEINDVLKEVRMVGIGYYDFSKLIPIKARSGLASPLNLIGPLCNPVRLSYKILGCTDERYARKIEPILEKICPNYIISCNPNVDEISPVEPTLILEKREGVKREYLFNPRECGFHLNDYSPILHPGNIGEMSPMILGALRGESSIARDTIALNAAAGIYLAGKSNSIQDAYDLSRFLMESGKSWYILNKWRNFQRANE